MRRRRARRDGLGAYLLVVLTLAGTAAIATFVAGRDQRTVYSTSERFHRHLVTHSYDPISDALRGFGPQATHAQPGRPEAGIRAVVLHPDHVGLVVGGKEIRRIPIASGEMNLADLVRIVHDRRWLAQAGRVVTAEAAVIAVGGSRLTVSDPATRTLVLESRPGVFLGARGSTLRLARVTVRPSVREANTRAGSTRPFVLAQRDSRMVISRSVLVDLGHDWNSSYGVSWSSGSTGEIARSQVLRCYIGVYTAGARDLVVRGNLLRGNTLYGVDPHSGSRGIVVVGNTAERNGRHGIIFSQNVSASVVRGNIARDNRLNGIMMDAGSTGNVITRNLVEYNHGDGIVLADSPGNSIVSNRILDNRIGIFARGGGSPRTIAGNVLAGNAEAAQGVGLPAGNEAHDNGGEWLPGRIRAIWLLAGLATVLLWWVTWRARRSRDRRVGRRLRRIPG
ncbi:MAG: right-handed parallel beta-helix repeat-containing protein [Gaiellaceae bacterium]